MTLAGPETNDKRGHLILRTVSLSSLCHMSSHYVRNQLTSDSSVYSERHNISRANLGLRPGFDRGAWGIIKKLLCRTLPFRSRTHASTDLKIRYYCGRP